MPNKQPITNPIINMFITEDNRAIISCDWITPINNDECFILVKKFVSLAVTTLQPVMLAPLQQAVVLRGNKNETDGEVAKYILNGLNTLRAHDDTDMPVVPPIKAFSSRNQHQ
jgi:hypothetical protein